MTFPSFFSDIFAEDLTLRLVQGGLLILGVVVVFLLLFATRDILLRTRSFLYQLACILLVALLPGIGFLLYLLIRPARTLKERATEARLQRIEESLPMLLPEDDLADLESDIADDIVGENDDAAVLGPQSSGQDDEARADEQET